MIDTDDPLAYRGLRPVQLRADGRALVLLDQRELPLAEIWLELTELEAIAEAIETLAVRGAPAIGCAAAIGLYVVSLSFAEDRARFLVQLDHAQTRLAATRPTAVNLFVALDRQREAIAAQPVGASVDWLRATLRTTAEQHLHADLAACLRLAEHGAAILPPGGILTHCNTGALAAAGHGTALGVIRTAWERSKSLHVYVDETRPLLQGSRLTAWELMRDGIPCSLITEGMAGYLMARGEIRAAIVGADRITARGDTANKIGTYGVAVLCKYHAIPFYVAAPWTTIDFALEHGRDIEIEERGADEVRLHAGVLRAPANVPVRNPAFDVTPAELITAVITDRGVFSIHTDRPHPFESD